MVPVTFFSFGVACELALVAQLNEKFRTFGANVHEENSKIDRNCNSNITEEHA